MASTDKKQLESTRSMMQQLGALMKKNVLIKLRQPASTVFEILLPVIIMVLLVFIRLAVTKSKIAPNLLESERADFIPDRQAALLLRGLAGANYRIAIAPDNLFTQKYAMRLRAQFATGLANYGTSFGLPPTLPVADYVQVYSSEGLIVDYCESEDYAKGGRPGVWGAVIFQQQGSNTVGNRQWKYSIRLNATDSSRTSVPQTVPDTSQIPTTEDLSVAYQGRNWRLFWNGGHMVMQALAEKLILEESAGVVHTTQWTFRPFPITDYWSDDFADYVESILGLLFTLVFIWPVTRLIKNIVEEKELKIRETMKMMGLTDFSLWLSWFLTYLVMFAISSALITAVTSNTVYELSNKGYIFIFFFLFSISVFGFCYMISAFFSRARVASTVGALIFFIIYFPYFAMNERTSMGSKVVACLSAPICFGQGATVITKLESANYGVNSSTAGTNIENFNVNAALGMLIFDCVLYLLLGMYFDRVIPQSFGVTLPWNFCCRPSYWRGHVIKTEETVSEDPADAVSSDRFEAVGADLLANVAVKVRQLRKVFDVNGTKVQAVKDLSVDMYEGQIFCLLGHNGAGKSTAISMLSGMYPPTSGDAQIYGYSILTDMFAIRQQLGICPQHNVLFDQLTVKEHLELFASIKGVPSALIDQQVRQIIEEVGLVEKTNVRSATLSGGQKRKLCVGMALIGGSKVVFLDEPTSGMDPYSRRSTWEMLRQAKAGRIIILTTHFMDEADQLGDRIAIMSKGSIRCCGSSLFLKSKYGVGYTFTISKKTDGNAVVHSHSHAGDEEDEKNGNQDGPISSKQLKKLVKKYVKDAELLTDVGGELSFRLPFESTHIFPSMFQHLDENLDTLGIESYGISVTTLEEVFLRVGHESDSLDNDVKAVKGSVSAQQNLNVATDLVPPAISPRHLEQSTESEMPTAKAIGGPLDALQLNANKKYHENISARRHFDLLIMKRWWNAKRDRKVFMWQIVYPFLILLAGVGLIKAALTFSFPSKGMDTGALNSPNRLPFNNDPAFASAPQSVLDGNTYWGNTVPLPLSGVTSENAMAQKLLDTFFDYKETKYGAFFWRFSNNTFHNFTLFVNTTCNYGLPIFFNQYNNALYQQLTSRDASAKIILSIDPLPLTKSQRSLQSSLTSIIFAIAFAFIPASFVSHIVKEREVSAKHQQLISGVDTLAYWMSNYVWDVCSYLISGVFAIIVLYIYDIQTLIGESIGGTVLAIILSALSVVSFTYACSFLFHNHVSAQNIMLMVYLFSGVILLILYIVLSIISSTQSANKVLVFFFRLLPNFCFGEVIANLSVRTATPVGGGIRGVWNMDVTGWALVYMALETFVYMAIVMGIEVIQRTPDWYRRWTRQVDVPEPPFAEDVDIVAEKQRVQSGGADKDIIRINGLRKVYNSGGVVKTAVRDLWFGIPEQQCFGFLGINGAGKTSTLKMLTGDDIPTKGTAYLAGMDIMTHQREIRHLIGYCPQFDALFDQMTAREHLILYAGIKGVPEAEVAALVDAIIQQVGLKDYADKPSGGYSGGNKRKLSVAIALIGNPVIVFLDEPSTGMDPQSRRFMWDLIARTMVGRSVILTTHSMEECEALCSRIGIMVGGRLRCVGSAQHLRHRYGDGYQIDFNTGTMPTTKAEQFIRSRFPNVEIVEQHVHNIKFRVPKDGNKLSALFGLIEAERKNIDVTEYSISETTLEQIFIQFAKQQEEETGSVKGLTDIPETKENGAGGDVIAVSGMPQQSVMLLPGHVSGGSS